MAWETDLVLTLRVLIGDFNDPQKNTDTYLKTVLVAAGIFVNNEIDLSEDYVFDITNVTIVPDPIAEGDVQTQALLPLKAACILNQSSFQVALSQGIKVRDGDSAIDTSVGFDGYKNILKLGPCAAYDQLRLQLQASDSALVGRAVLGAYRGPSDSPIDTVAWFYDGVASLINNCRTDR